MSAMGTPKGTAVAPMLSLLSTLLLVAILLATILLLSRTHHEATCSQSPPGPFVWPLVGNILQLDRLPHLTFTCMVCRYGPIFQLRLGRHRVLVLNGDVAIRQALVGLGTRFAGWPDFSSFGMVSGGQHRQTFDWRAIRDISDVMIATVERGSGCSDGLGPEDVEGAMTDIFGAGQDTTSTALSWILLLLLKHPQTQQDLQAELDRVAGHGRLPTAEDRPHIPLPEAFIYETLCYSSFVPITIPHATAADVELEGFHIPKGTCQPVVGHQWGGREHLALNASSSCCLRVPMAAARPCSNKHF
ncbi:LOW QUALITY PROTEIN: cytochrome P450 1B1-like [Cyrtonyx montezumae]|uniref:LOW QUALITY PROTEIN: cytochrome P450 1B1-like n=1 Tax=Cyrtonyx montezumae TaxID=9017 RepID=UPI0032DAA844